MLVGRGDKMLLVMSGHSYRDRVEI